MTNAEARFNKSLRPRKPEGSKNVFLFEMYIYAGPDCGQSGAFGPKLILVLMEFKGGGGGMGVGVGGCPSDEIITRGLPCVDMQKDHTHAC